MAAETARIFPRPRLHHRALGLAQKAYDFARFVYHRIRMSVEFQRNRIRRRWRLGRQVRRILVVRLASIGDVVRASAVVRRLRDRYPDAEIDFLTTDAALPAIRRNSALSAVYTLKDLDRLRPYDWMVNLQNRYPPESFLHGSGLTYRQVLEHLSNRLGCTFISGRHVEHGQEISPTDIQYCVSEMEELFLIALMSFDPDRYPKTDLEVDEHVLAAALAKFAIPADRPTMAIFLGANSVGCGADEGFRTYSIDYLERLVQHFYDQFTVVVIGQSQVRNPVERQRYADIVKRHPRLVDLVDRTSLDELIAIMSAIQILVTCDSSPVHIALARGVPVVGVYVNDATFRMSPTLENEHFICLNSVPPCFAYSWRWKFFCGTCRNAATRAHYCSNDAFVFGVDRIPIDRIDRAVRKLLTSQSLPQEARLVPASPARSTGTVERGRLGSDA